MNTKESKCGRSPHASVMTSLCLRYVAARVTSLRNVTPLRVTLKVNVSLIVSNVSVFVFLFLLNYLYIFMVIHFVILFLLNLIGISGIYTVNFKCWQKEFSKTASYLTIIIIIISKRNFYLIIKNS